MSRILVVGVGLLWLLVSLSAAAALQALNLNLPVAQAFAKALMPGSTSSEQVRALGEWSRLALVFGVAPALFGAVPLAIWTKRARGFSGLFWLVAVFGIVAIACSAVIGGVSASLGASSPIEGRAGGPPTELIAGFFILLIALTVNMVDGARSGSGLAYLAFGSAGWFAACIQAVAASIATAGSDGPRGTVVDQAHMLSDFLAPGLVIVLCGFSVIAVMMRQAGRAMPWLVGFAHGLLVLSAAVVWAVGLRQPGDHTAVAGLVWVGLVALGLVLVAIISAVPRRVFRKQPAVVSRLDMPL